MSVVINMQPGMGTLVRVVENGVEPPMLVIYDGTATVFFSPAGMRGALEAAQRFAEALATAGVEWALTCSRAIEAAQGSDPLGVGAVLAEHGDLGDRTG